MTSYLGQSQRETRSRPPVPHQRSTALHQHRAMDTVIDTHRSSFSREMHTSTPCAAQQPAVVDVNVRRVCPSIGINIAENFPSSPPRAQRRYPTSQHGQHRLRHSQTRIHGLPGRQGRQALGQHRRAHPGHAHHVRLWHQAVQHGRLAARQQRRQDRAHALGGRLCPRKGGLSTACRHPYGPTTDEDR